MSAPTSPDRPVPSTARLIFTWLAMLSALAIDAISDFLPIGGYLPWLQFAMAAFILALLAFLWMKLASATAAVRIAAFVAIFFLFILAFLSFNDFLTRPMDLAPFGKLPSIAAPM